MQWNQRFRKAILCSLLIACFSEVEAATFMVTSSANSGFGTLRQAISDANSLAGDDDIVFDPSVTYIAVFTSLSIDESLTITGPSSKVTVDGNLGTIIFDIPNSGGTPTIELENLIIQNGNTGGFGGAIRMNSNGELFIDNCNLLFSDASQGGAIYSPNANLYVSNSHFEGNRAISWGGGSIYAGRNIEITSCSFINNYAFGSFGAGGGIYADSPSIVNITNSTFSNNQANRWGGALYADGLVANIVNSTFYQNLADADLNGSGTGGGLYSSSSFTTLVNSIFYGNTTNGVSDDVQNSGSSFSGNASLVGVCTGGCGTGVVDYTSDPNLAAAQTCNGLTYFEPQSPSDAINNGIINTSTPTTDMCGTVWAAGTINLGSYEHVSGLPIELIGFEAVRRNDREVMLTWMTISELNNAGFDIEMSEDGQSFQRIGFVEGAGNSSAMKNYDFNAQRSKAAYYRLKQMDFDGGYTYSKVRFAEAASDDPKMYPNPTQKEAFIDLGKVYRDVQLRVYNYSGTMVLSENFKDIQMLQFDVVDTGIYVVEVLFDGNSAHSKLIKTE